MLTVSDDGSGPGAAREGDDPSVRMIGYRARLLGGSALLHHPPAEHGLIEVTIPLHSAAGPPPGDLPT